jgi:hypothetical protein
MKYAFSLIAVLLLVGCGTLNPTGPYKGDRVLYDADQVIVTGYDLLHVYVQWEFSNREALATHPEIKVTADHVRVNAKGWFRTAKNLRAAYAVSATDINKTALQQAISLIRAVVAEATGYLTTYGPAKAK